jgi:IS30 family transposase
MVDIASRLYIIRPIPTKTSLAIIKELIDVFTTFGLPRVIQSDSGKEFVNEIMTLFAENADSPTSYKPQKEIIGPHIRLLRLNEDY